MNFLYGFLAIGAGVFLTCLGFVLIAYWLRTQAQKREKPVHALAKETALPLIYWGILFIFLGLLYLMETTLSALLIGMTLIAVGCFFLVVYLPFVAQRWEASISIFAQKASFALIIGGLILTILYFLNLMKLLPWWPIA